MYLLISHFYTADGDEWEKLTLCTSKCHAHTVAATLVTEYRKPKSGEIPFTHMQFSLHTVGESEGNLDSRVVAQRLEHFDGGLKWDQRTQDDATDSFYTPVDNSEEPTMAMEDDEKFPISSFFWPVSG